MVFYYGGDLFVWLFLLFYGVYTHVFHKKLFDIFIITLLFNLDQKLLSLSYTYLKFYTHKIIES